MSVLQFSLFFTALLVGYFLLHLRLVRFEEHLQKLAGIRSMDDRLRSLDDRLLQLVTAFEKVGLERIEARLERIQEGLEDLREATTDVRHAVVQIPAASPAQVDQRASSTPSETSVAPVAASIANLVEARLLQLGYSNIDVLTDLRGARVDEQIEVQVECERSGMPAKGRVIVRNGSVRDVALQTVAQMFP
ncbi:MAG: hypothetical protein JNK78_16845 [Planctomycetes bacterium]|nr:hypothetical protein [Planctomycetota bacterium]